MSVHMMYTESASTDCEAHAYSFISSLDALATFSGISEMPAPGSQVFALASVVAVILLVWAGLAAYNTRRL